MSGRRTGDSALAAQQVEVVRGRRAGRHGHIVLRGQLQEALRTSGGMVRALALLPVRQQQRDRRALTPLRLAGGDELVDDRLRAVGEVAELRLPAHQRVLPHDRVAVLKAHRGELAEQRVIGPERCLVRRKVFQRGVLRARVAVDQRGVPLGERAAPGVLAGEPHRAALQHQRAEGEQLSGPPVHVAVAGHRDPPVDLRLEAGVDGETFRRVGVGVTDALDHLQAWSRW